MPNFPPNYAEQEKFYASEIYQTGAKEAIKNNQPLPKYEPPTSESNVATKGQTPAKKSLRRGGILRYPLEALTGTTDYLQINIIEYKRTPNQFTRPTGFGANTLTSAAGGTTSGSLARRSVINDGSILLQVPSNVQDGNAVNFGDSSMNTLIGAAAGIVGNVMGSGGQAVADIVSGKKTLSEGLGDFGTDVKSDTQKRFEKHCNQKT